jgi:hypothetical protein
MAYDAATSQLVRFGGYGGSGDVVGYVGLGWH